MNISDHVNSRNFARDFQALDNLLGSSQSSISIWGIRVIHALNYTGSVDLDLIVSKIRTIMMRRCEADDFTLSERITGMSIIRKLQYFYKSTDKRLKKMSCIQRCLCGIREPNEFSKRIRNCIEDGSIESHFLDSNADLFCQEFGWNEESKAFSPALRVNMDSERQFLIKKKENQAALSQIDRETLLFSEEQEFDFCNV
jgi:hypothetical protein